MFNLLLDGLFCVVIVYTFVDFVFGCGFIFGFWFDSCSYF